MKVAFDLRPLQIGHENRGIGAYILNVLQNTPSNKDISFIFLRYDTSDPITEFGIGKNLEYQQVIVKKRVFSRSPLKLILYGISNLRPAFFKLAPYRPDVFVQCDYLLGAPRIMNCKVVTVAYDLIPFKFSSVYLPNWKKYYGYRQLKFKSRVRLMLRAWYYQRKYQNGLRLMKRANLIISISKNTTADLIEFANIKKEKIATIYPAPSFRQDKGGTTIRDELINLVGSVKTPIITYIGGTDYRRKVDDLVSAFNLYNARKSPITLLLGGNEFTATSKSLSAFAKHAIDTSSYRDSIHMLGKITEAEKKYILERSSVFVYPTLYEGFGLPVLEAMQAGCPVITYKNSSIPEIAGEAAVYAKKEGQYAIYESLVSLLNDPAQLKKMYTKGKNQASKFNWEESTKQLWGQIQEITKK